mmetsp:Transcript_63709/g.106270  ORF Transcript_63709/g.106270 Transcript_63709/m.106270 type:complete len:245 (+) Transcript_63709:352-1086(+)
MVRAPHSSEYICRTAFRFFFSSVYLRSAPLRKHILLRLASGQAHVYRPCRPTDVAVVRPPSVFLPPWPPDLVCGVDLLRHLPAPLPCTCWPALVHLSILTCHTHTHTRARTHTHTHGGSATFVALPVVPLCARFYSSATVDFGRRWLLSSRTCLEIHTRELHEGPGVPCLGHAHIVVLCERCSHPGHFGMRHAPTQPRHRVHCINHPLFATHKEAFATFPHGPRGYGKGGDSPMQCVLCSFRFL